MAGMRMQTYWHKVVFSRYGPVTVCTYSILFTLVIINYKILVWSSLPWGRTHTIEVQSNNTCDDKLKKNKGHCGHSLLTTTVSSFVLNYNFKHSLEKDSQEKSKASATNNLFWFDLPKAGKHTIQIGLSIHLVEVVGLHSICWLSGGSSSDSFAERPWWIYTGAIKLTICSCLANLFP